jgi:hypothetical protein
MRLAWSGQRVAEIDRQRIGRGQMRTRGGEQQQ